MVKENINDSKTIYLNFGTSSSCLTETIEVMQQAFYTESICGGGSPEILRMKGEVLSKTRVSVSELLNCPAGSVSLSSNTTEGVNIITNGLDFQLNDEIITTDMEHDSCLVPFEMLKLNKGVKIKIIKVANFTDDQGNFLEERFFSELNRLITKRTKMVFLSHVLYTTGLELPVKRICHLLRKRGIDSLIDGAQAVGHISVDVADIGCDYYAFTGGKWLNGPTGTGALYIRPDKISTLKQTFSGWASISDLSPSLLKNSADRFEVSTRSIPLLKGFGHAIDLHKQALERNPHKISSMAKLVRNELRNWSSVEVYPSLSINGIVTFKNINMHYEVMFQEFIKCGIIGRCIEEMEAVRFSISHYAKERDIEKLIKTCYKVLA